MKAHGTIKIAEVFCGLTPGIQDIAAKLSLPAGAKLSEMAESVSASNLIRGGAELPLTASSAQRTMRMFTAPLPHRPAKNTEFYDNSRKMKTGLEACGAQAIDALRASIDEQHMQFFNEGDRSKAFCTQCKTVGSTTFEYRDVPFSDGSGVVRDILAGVCDACGSVASVPAQSTPAIAKARSKASEAVEAVLPAPYLDMLDLACFTIDPEGSLDLRKALLMYYVRRFANGSFDVDRLEKSARWLAAKPAMESTRKRRLSMKVSHRLLLELNGLAKRSDMKKTETLKAIIGVIYEDLVNGGHPELVANIREYSVFAVG